MDLQAQKQGEERVEEFLIMPLLRRGLVKPSHLTKGAFDDMVSDLKKRLAYMSADNLAALEEHSSARPSGKGKDRCPIANDILKWSFDFQEPPADGSPLLRAMMRHQTGQDAIAEGWAPELFAWVKQHRQFAKGYALTQIRQSSEANVRRMRDLDRRLQQGRDLTSEETLWRHKRMKEVDLCKALAGVVQ